MAPSLATRQDIRRHPDGIDGPIAKRGETRAWAYYPVLHRPPPLHHIEAGEGETVLLLHGSAGTGALWCQAMKSLQPLYRVVAPDLIGYGRSPAWPAGIPYGTDGEVRALRALLPSCADKYHLVGHSYGGVVALMLALANPVRVRTLTLIEPVFFAALRHGGLEAAFLRFVAVREAFVSALAGNGPEAAMRAFIDFWAGEGAWQATTVTQRNRLLQSADKIALDWRAAFAADADLDRLAALGVRTFLLRGDRSPEPMLSLVDALHRLVPGSTHIVVAGAGHALPATHASELTRAMMCHFHVESERRLR